VGQTEPDFAKQDAIAILSVSITVISQVYQQFHDDKLLIWPAKLPIFYVNLTGR
jgi:hypothetical protein